MRTRPNTTGSAPPRAGRGGPSTALRTTRTRRPGPARQRHPWSCRRSRRTRAPLGCGPDRSGVTSRPRPPRPAARRRGGRASPRIVRRRAAASSRRRGGGGRTERLAPAGRGCNSGPRHLPPTPQRRRGRRSSVGVAPCVHRRHRAGTGTGRGRPGRCATGRCGACPPPGRRSPRVVVRRRCGRPRPPRATQRRQRTPPPRLPPDPTAARRLPPPRGARPPRASPRGPWSPGHRRRAGVGRRCRR